MGGRSAKKNNFIDQRWSWLSELSDSRLNNYIQYASIQDQQERKQAASSYINTSTANFLDHLRKEQEKRGRS